MPYLVIIIGSNQLTVRSQSLPSEHMMIMVVVLLLLLKMTK